MSNSDSFIDEVSEELRRDRLYALFRRYGWIAIAVVLLLVGAAALNEWRKARAESAAQALGDAILEARAVEAPQARAEALAAIDADGTTAALLDLMIAAGRTGEPGAARARLGEIAADDGLARRYRDLAVLKLALLDTGDGAPAERIAALEPLTAAGAPYRLLALEQMAIARVEAGETDAALAILRDILAADRLTQGLRRRVSQLIVALGGRIEAT